MQRFLGIILMAVVAGSPCATGPANATTAPQEPADLIVHNAKIITLEQALPEAQALAVRGETFVSVGREEQVMMFRGDQTRVIDAGGRRVIPGLNDSHIHAVRGGRFYNLELRWDGVESLEQGLRMVRDQAKRTPKGQWVRVIGGWSPYQFKKRRMPAVAELNAAPPDTPVFVLFLYSQALINQAGVAALQLTPQSIPPAGGDEQRKGTIASGRYADFAVLSADYLQVPDEQIRTIESVMTVTGGDVVYAAEPFVKFAPEQMPAVSPAWSPVAVFGGYQQSSQTGQ